MIIQKQPSKKLYKEGAIRNFANLIEDLQEGNCAEVSFLIQFDAVDLQLH